MTATLDKSPSTVNSPAINSKSRRPQAEIPSNWVLPHSIEAERSLLGCLIAAPRDMSQEAASRLIEEVFYDQRHQIIFSAIRTLHEANLPVDTVTLPQKLTDAGVLDAVGGYGYIAQIIAEVPTPTNIFTYAEIVREKYLLRRVMVACAEVLQSVKENADDPKPVLELAQEQFFVISQDRIEKEAQPVSELVIPALRLIEKYYQNKGKVVGIPSGFADLDSLTGGFQSGQMVVIAARPGMGKTSFALNVAEHASVDAKKAVAIFSLEMTNQELMMRLLASRARVSSQTIRKGFTTQEDLMRITHAAHEIKDAPLYFDSTVGLTLAQLRTRARRLKKRYNIDMIIVDYLQLIMPPAHRRNDNRAVEVAEISGGVKAMAMELEIPVLVLSQLNRKPDERGGQPRLSDLRESGAIEQDADIVGLLYRPEKYADDDEERGTLTGEAILDIQKHRNGPTEKISLTFLEQLTRFENRSLSSQDSL